MHATARDVRRGTIDRHFEAAGERQRHGVEVVRRIVEKREIVRILAPIGLGVVGEHDGAGTQLRRDRLDLRHALDTDGLHLALLLWLEWADFKIAEKGIRISGIGILSSHPARDRA